MKMLVGAQQWYLSFLEKDKKNILEKILYFVLYALSFIYGAAVFTRNFLYDKGILRSFSSKSKVISVGNLSWSGSGKTSLSLWLYGKLSPSQRTAILRRGYGSDEGKLISETTKDVFSSVNRVNLVKNLQSAFDVFILDDGFQHRKLQPDVNVVIMGAREFKKKHRLIPAYFFREPLSSLKRADILLLNYKEEFDNITRVKQLINKVAPHLNIYTCGYRPGKFLNLEGKEIAAEALRSRKIAAFAAIGYPQGFFNKLKKLDFDLKDQIIYPDHHQLTEQEFKSIEKNLTKKGIKDLLITPKDKYHLPKCKTDLNIFVMDVMIEVDNQEAFLKELSRYLAK